MRRFVTALAMVVATLGFACLIQVEPRQPDAESQQSQIVDSLRVGWDERTMPSIVTPVSEPGWVVTPVAHEPSAVLRIARFGKGWERPIIAGFTASDFEKGVGAWAEGGVPGEGNLVLGGHRVTRGEPFRDIPKLRKGDRIEVETKDTTWTYRATAPALKIEDTDTWVMGQSPTKAHLATSKPILTLLTCSETAVRSSGRLVVFAVLEGSRART